MNELELLPSFDSATCPPASATAVIVPRTQLVQLRVTDWPAPSPPVIGNDPPGTSTLMVNGPAEAVPTLATVTLVALRLVTTRSGAGGGPIVHE